MEVKGPILTAFNNSKEHQLDPYWGKGRKNQKLSLKFLFTLV